MRITIDIPEKQIAAVLDCAASTSWVSRLDWPSCKAIDVDGDSCWDALMAGAIDFVFVYEDPRDEGKRPREHRVTRSKIAIAFDIMAREHPRRLGEACSRFGFDSNTGDALLQLAALGELRYG